MSIRIDLAGGAQIGPGKIRLLEEIGLAGSISAAGRAMHMSYRRAWDLVEDMNRSLGGPVVETATGGAGGGGARLTELGALVVAQYRALEVAAATSAQAHLRVLDTAVGPLTPPGNRPAAAGRAGKTGSGRA